jgi:hypothetical protein
MLSPGRPAGSRPTTTRVASITGAVVFVLSVLSAFSRPFTWPADALTALGLAGVAAIVGVQLLGNPPALLARRAAPGDEAVASHPGVSRWATWAVAIALVVAWELFCYLSAPRALHPTLSSLLDTVTGSHAGRGVAFATWLLLGTYLVTR